MLRIGSYNVRTLIAEGQANLEVFEGHGHGLLIGFGHIVRDANGVGQHDAAGNRR